MSYRATVHPHAVSRFVRMDVVALDLRRLALHWAVGTKDERAASLAAVSPTGLIPEDLHSKTAFIFNGGFQARHGRWGIVSRDVVLQELKPEGCVVALRAANHQHASQIELGPWSRLESRRTEFVTIRQTPPCLLDEGEVHPWLSSGRNKPWAGQHAERKTRRRSAVGIDAGGQTLFYAIGTETEAIDLARGMKAVGATTALELDINWNWTRFLVPAESEPGRYRVSHALIEDMAYGKNEYFSRPSERDFFFLIRR